MTRKQHAHLDAPSYKSHVVSSSRVCTEPAAANIAAAEELLAPRVSVAA
jgi:hypothetical protein